MASLTPLRPVLIPAMPLLAIFDLANHQAAAITQNRLIYGTAIVGRDKAEFNRSKIAGLEAVQRDAAGFLGFNFAGSLIRRLYLRFVAPPDIRSGLIQVKAKPENGFKQFMWRFEPISRYDIINTSQLRERKQLTLQSLASAFGTESKAYQRTAALFEKMIKHHSAASFTALVTSILFLSVGIQLMNMYLTYIRKQHAMTHSAQPTALVAPPKFSNVV
ncbi:MAG: hypothetical protein VKK59_05815 [Vampirovibrionales bacterium]|nr:hypothetical protein [Vampirovibrionales bacterium]